MDATTTFARALSAAPTNRQRDKALEIAHRVRDWAAKNYDSKRYAWHMLIETWTVGEMAEDLLAYGVTSYDRALTHFRKTTGLWAEQERAHRTEARMGYAGRRYDTLDEDFEF